MSYNKRGDTSAMKAPDPRKAFIIAFVLFSLLGFGAMSFYLYKAQQLQLQTEQMLDSIYSRGFIEGYEQALKDRQRRGK